MTKSRWDYLASLALLTEQPIYGATTYIYAESETEYRNQCRKLIPDHEINWQASVDGVLRTDIQAGTYDIVIVCTLKKEPQRPPSLVIVG
jgi:hypothetical protein